MREGVAAAAGPIVRPESVQDHRRRRRALLSASIGTAIEYYDFTVYAFLATTLAAVFFRSNEPGVALLSTFAVFAVSFFVRPIGGLLVGQLADRIGRKRALNVSVIGMAAASFLIGLIPDYESIGIAAPTLLVVMRCLQGLSAGGELASAASYVAEEAPPAKRGHLTSFVNLGTLVGTLCGSLIVALLRAVLPAADMVAWAWRIPFLISLPLGIVALVIRTRMEESVMFEAVAKTGAITRAPVGDLLRQHGRGVFNVTMVNLASFAAFYLAFTYVGTYFETQHIMSVSGAAWSTTITVALAGAAMPFYGTLSDRLGRRPVLVATNIAFIVVAYPAFLLMNAGPVVALLSLVVLGQLEAIYMSTLLATYAEMFPVRVRVSGFALGYNFSSILTGGTAAYVATWLISTTGSASSPALFLITAATCSLVASVFLKETAGQALPLD